MSLEVRTRDDPKATVFRSGISKVNHQEALYRLRSITNGIVPEPTVLVPKQWWAVSWFANDSAMPEFRLCKPELKEGIEDFRVRNKLGNNPVSISHFPIDQYHASGRLLLFKML